MTDDYIVCLEDGKKLKMLKRHLMTAYGMTPEEYRAKWGLSPNSIRQSLADQEARETKSSEVHECGITVPEIAPGAEVSSDAALALRLDMIEARLEELSGQFWPDRTIELAVSDNAERAMSIPLLRRDIEGLKQNVASGSSPTKLRSTGYTT